MRSGIQVSAHPDLNGPVAVRARAVNSVGETQGDDQTFTTAGSPMEVWKFAHFGAAWTSVDMSDFLATPALVGSEYRLMAQTDTRLDKMHAFVSRMIRDNGVDATVMSTNDRREARRGADYVVVMLQAGGVGEFRQDYEIPAAICRPLPACRARHQRASGPPTPGGATRPGAGHCQSLRHPRQRLMPSPPP